MRGLSHIKGKDLARVRAANRLVRRMCGLCRLCNSLDIAYYIENPRTSRLWLLPPILHLSNLRDTQIAQFDFCQFGTPWRKATSVLVYGNPNLAQQQRVCHFLIGYFCSGSGKRHVQLTGVDEHGQHLTHVAEPYPARLCKHWSSLIKDQAISDHMTARMRSLKS